MTNIFYLQKNSKTNESGFSVLELMISLIIFLVFISALYGLLRIGNIQRSTVTSSSEVIKNARLSLNSIGRDAVNAGFGYSRVGGFAPDNVTNLRMNLPADTNTEQDLLTSLMAGNDINTNSLLPTGRTDVISFLFRDITFNNGEPITFTNAELTGTNHVRVTTAPGDGSIVNRYDLFLISDGARTTIGIVTRLIDSDTIDFQFGNADPLKVNAPYNGTTETRSRLRACSSPTENNCFDYSNIITAKRITWVSYHIDNDGTLLRTLYGNNTGENKNKQIQPLPIAFNVQNLQIRYLLRDGTISDDPSNLNSNPSNLNNVVQIEVTLTTRVPVVVDQVDTEKFVNLKSTFSTKNLLYDIG